MKSQELLTILWNLIKTDRQSKEKPISQVSLSFKNKSSPVFFRWPEIHFSNKTSQTFKNQKLSKTTGNSSQQRFSKLWIHNFKIGLIHTNLFLGLYSSITSGLYSLIKSGQYHKVDKGLPG